MKTKLFLLILSIAITFSVEAQIRKIPSEVTDAFKQKYATASNVEWRDKLTYFEASFTIDKVEWTADFNTNGDWKESSKQIDFENLPAEVKDGFSKSKYNDWTKGTVSLIQKQDEDDTYRVYVEKNNIFQKRYLYFNSDGQLLKESPGL